MNIPRQSDLDNPDFLMRELLMDYEAEWLEVCIAAIEAGYLLAPEPRRPQ